jgi:hypothetical protein
MRLLDQIGELTPLSSKGVEGPFCPLRFRPGSQTAGEAEPLLEKGVPGELHCLL